MIGIWRRQPFVLNVFSFLLFRSFLRFAETFLYILSELKDSFLFIEITLIRISLSINNPLCVRVKAGAFAFYRDQLWTAPELLRMTTRPINGTQKADVYSFAIVLQEIMFRAEPYFIDIDPPQCV